MAFLRADVSGCAILGRMGTNSPRLAAALAAACGAVLACSSSSTTPARTPRFAGARWEALAAGGPSSPGLSDFTPQGEPGFFALDGSSAFRFDPALGWSALAPPPTSLGYSAGPAWAGGALYVLRNDAVFRYDVTAGTWSEPVTSGVGDTFSSQAAHDDAGNVYTLETPSPKRIIRYTPATGAVAKLDTGGLGGNPPGATIPPRLTWDSATRRLYIAPVYDQLWVFDPAAPGTAVRRADLPAPPGPMVFLGSLLCSDRAGHVYAVGVNGPCVGESGVYEYDTAADTWDPLPAPTTTMLCQSSCTVASGWLYLAGGPGAAGSLYRIRLP
jgi:hypothetical protein